MPSSKKSSKDTDETKVSDVAKEPRKEVRKKPKMFTLRLKQNDFIDGKFAKAGSTKEFTQEEAQKRLREETKWEPV